MNNAFFTSDTHFGHARIIELSGRPFDSVEEMNESMIERWNSVVDPSDVVYHLGDAVMGKFDENIKLIGRLNGTKILVPGNHDRVFSGHKQSYIDRNWPIYMNYFDNIVAEQFVFPGWKVMMCHFPYFGDSHMEDRFSEHRPEDRGLPLLHGHVHEMWRTNGRQFNVGVDVNDFFPVSLDVIQDWVDDIRG